MAKKTTQKRKTLSSPVSKSNTTKKPYYYLIVGFLVVIVLLLLYYFKGLLVAAVVNGKPIFRLTVVSDLEKQAGKEVLDSLITRNLLIQEAERRGIVVTEEDVNKEVKKVSDDVAAQGQKLDQLLEAQRLTMSEFRDRIRIQKIVEKMFEKEMQVSQTEIDKFVEENQETIPQDMSPEALREGAKQQLQQQKLNDLVQKLIARLKKEAQIKYFVTY